MWQKSMTEKQNREARKRIKIEKSDRNAWQKSVKVSCLSVTLFAMHFCHAFLSQIILFQATKKLSIAIYLILITDSLKKKQLQNKSDSKTAIIPIWLIEILFFLQRLTLIVPKY